ncbi:MAG: serine protease [Anaerolineae bacterium]|nr:serine protease [Anaerolineae bacterium]
MITSNILQRTLFIGHQGSLGTGFTVDQDDRQYLVTARHVVGNIRDGDIVDIYHDNQWKQTEVKRIEVPRPDIDILVLAPSQQLTPSLKFFATSEGLGVSQDIYFLGFPYGWRSSDAYTLTLNNGFPFPLVKKGIISAFGPNVDYFLIDGHNNPGFSGGPVVFSDGKKIKVAGVISGYRISNEPIFDSSGHTNFYYKYNTGIVKGYDIRFAVDAIKANPVGCSISV